MDGNNAQLNQYEKSLADLVAAYKLLQKQNETLQSTLNVIIDKPTTLQEKQSNSDIKSKYELLKLNLAKTSSQLANMQSCYGVERKAILAEKTAILTEYDSYKIEKTKEIENLTEKLNTKPCCDVDVIALQNDKISIICNNLLKSESDNLKHVQTIQRQTNIIKELSEKIEKYSTVVSISKPKGNLMSPQPNNLQKTILFLQRKINRLENKLKSSSNQNCDACKSESVDTQIDLSSNPSMNNYDNSDDSMYKMIANEEEKIEAKYCSLCADLSIDIGNKNKLISEYQNILVMKDKEIERIGQKFKNILLEKQHEISYLNDLESSNNRPNKTLHIKQQDFQDKLKYLKIKNELMKKQLDQYTVKNLIKKDSLSTEIIEEGAKMNYLKKLILSYFTTDNIDQKSVFSKVIVQILNVSDSEKDVFRKFLMYL